LGFMRLPGGRRVTELPASLRKEGPGPTTPSPKAPEEAPGEGTPASPLWGAKNGGYLVTEAAGGGRSAESAK
jgi:hypothetical protein